MATAASVGIDTVPLPDRSIRIVLPASVAFDLAKFTKAMGSLAERIGHRSCLSGADCRLSIERDFIVNPKTLAIQSLAGGVMDGER